MRAVGILGSARLNGNTAQLLDSAMRGAADCGVEIKRYDLYSLRYMGCRSCFACKRIGGTSHGRCAVKDDLEPVLEDILNSDLLFIASPIYFGDVSGETRSFLERLWFPSLLYRKDGEVAYNRKLKTALLYTMNVEDPMAFGYGHLFEQNSEMCQQYLGEIHTLWASDTYQYNDYAKYESSIFDEEHKKKVHEFTFPLDLQRAYELGRSLASSSVRR